MPSYPHTSAVGRLAAQKRLLKWSRDPACQSWPGLGLKTICSTTNGKNAQGKLSVGLLQLILSAIFIDLISDLRPSFVTGQGLLFIMGMSLECQCNKHKTNKSMIFVFRGYSRQASSSWPDRYRQANSRTFRLTVERRQRSMCCDDMTSPPVFWWSSRSTQGPKDDASPDFMPFLQ